MFRSNIALSTALAMLAFAGNSILCRLALKTTAIDPASFTAIRLISAALLLAILMRFKGQSVAGTGNWKSAGALFAYAAGFSVAYVNLSAGTGALLLFGAVQLSMISISLWRGEKVSALQIFGLALAFAGLVVLVLPGLAAPPLLSCAFMIGAGIAWGIYSLRGRGMADATAVTCGNFIRTIPMAAILFIIFFDQVHFDQLGLVYAVLAGAITSGLGYAIWYKVLPGLKPLEASVVQLSVPVIAAFAGIVLMGEVMSLRLVVASIAVLGGIFLVTLAKTVGQARPAKP